MLPKKVMLKVKEIEKALEKENKKLGHYEYKFRIYHFDVQPFLNVLAKEKDQERSPIVRTGFRALIQNMEPRLKHSLDYKTYIHERIPAIVFHDVIIKKIPIEIHKASLGRSFKSLYDRGYKHIFRIETPEGDSKELYIAINSAGKCVYCILKILGEDKLAHLEAHLRLCKYKNRYVDSSMVTVYDFRTNYYKKFKDEIEKFFKRAPDVLLIDGKNTLHKVLVRRVFSQKRFEKLKELYGVENTVENLIDSFASEPEVFDDLEKFFDDELRQVMQIRDSKLILMNQQYSQAIEKIYFYLDGLESKYPHITLFPNLVIKPFTIAEDVFGLYADYNVIKFKDKQGKTRSIMNVRVPYGELSSILVDIVLAKGTQNVIFFGSAGGLKESHKIADVDFPSSFYDDRENLIGHPGIARNDLLDFIKKNPKFISKDFHLGTRHVSVGSPLEEFNKVIYAFKKAKYDEVEIEATDVIQAVIKFQETKNKKVRFGAVFAISDVPLSPETLASYQHLKPKVKKVAETIADILFPYLGITEVISQPIKRIRFTVLKKLDSIWTVKMDKKKYAFEFLEQLSDGRKVFLINLMLIKISQGISTDNLLKDHKVVVK